MGEEGFAEIPRQAAKAAFVPEVDLPQPVARGIETLSKEQIRFVGRVEMRDAIGVDEDAARAAGGRPTGRNGDALALHDQDWKTQSRAFEQSGYLLGAMHDCRHPKTVPRMAHGSRIRQLCRAAARRCTRSPAHLVLYGCA